MDKDFVRPTLGQLKAAMEWWNSLGCVNPPPETLKAVREALGLRPGQGMAASDIARYWIKNVAPDQSPAEGEKEPAP